MVEFWQRKPPRWRGGSIVTEVEFHTGVSDPQTFTCRLLRKAWRQGVRVQVTAPAETLDALDRQLWAFDERDFVPHARLPAASPALRERSPIWLTPEVVGGRAPRVVVNLDEQAPTDLAGLDRLIEVVSTDAEQADRGRQRWRAYKALGLSIKHHGEPGADRG